MRKTRILLYLLLVVALLLAGAYAWFVHAPTPERPSLGGAVEEGSLQVGTLQRSYIAYVPARLPAHAPLLLVLHGSLQTSEDIRIFSGYEFERLADAYGFVVVYPQGYERNWNDCRRSASYPAKVQNIDDIGFMQALIAQMAQQHGIDPQHVFLAGYSNGAHLGFRLALEQPGLLGGVAAVSASLPTADNLDCKQSGKPVAMLIMNGTADPVNPYAGGKVTLYGFGNRGTVRSALQTAEYFASLAGYPITPHRSVAWSQAQPAEQVTLDQWRRPGSVEVALYTVEEGGHLVPQPLFRAPRMLGKTLSGFNGPEAIWDFFSRQSLQPVSP